MMAQAFQVGVATAAGDALQPALLWTMAAPFTIANLPVAVMLLATAVPEQARKAAKGDKRG